MNYYYLMYYFNISIYLLIALCWFSNYKIRMFLITLLILSKAIIVYR